MHKANFEILYCFKRLIATQKALAYCRCLLHKGTLHHKCLHMLLYLFTERQNSRLHQIESFCRRQFKPFPNKPWFLTCLQHKTFENTVGKGEIAHNEHFSFTHSVFYPLGDLSAIFVKFEIVGCKLFQLRRV